MPHCKDPGNIQTNLAALTGFLRHKSSIFCFYLRPSPSQVESRFLHIPVM